MHANSIKDWRLDASRKAILSVSAILLGIMVCSLTLYFCLRHKFLTTPDRINGWAVFLSVASVATLAAIYWLIQRFVPAAQTAAASLDLPRRQRVIALALASMWIALCLPATFRAVVHPREVMVFWHDEGLTLEFAQAFITGETEVPQYRWTQGWVTFLPVVIPLKLLNLAVPVNYALTNITFRSYQLLIMFGIVYFTYRLAWQMTRSWWLATATVIIAYTRDEFFHISLAIDRPDTFQLLFVLLALINAHRFWVEGQARYWFQAVLFAGFAFASKYSGHLLLPVLLLAFVAHWRRIEVQQVWPSPWKRWTVGAAAFALSICLIYPFTFFTLSPYHLIRFAEVVDFFRTYLPIYRSGNVHNVPGHEAPSHFLLWWGVFTSRYAFDYWLTILGGCGAAITLVKNLVSRTASSQKAGEWLLLAWGSCYISFLVYQYGLVDYRYIMPAQFVLPFFLLAPILWLQQATVVGRVPYRTVLGFTAITAVFLLCGLRIHSTLGFLGRFRSEASMQQCFDVGRYLDRTVSTDEDPKILMTNLAYIPPRFTKLWVNNVDVTNEFIGKNQFDYVIITSNMYKIYADKPTKGAEKQYDPLYKVYYPDVVNAYTAFKHNNHPDYRFVESFGDYLYLYERIDRPKPGERVSSTK